MLEELPDSFAASRDGLHALAEQVLAPFRYALDGHIGLVPTPDGFGTPMSANGDRLRVDGVELVLERPGTTTRVRITTIADAARFAGVEPGVPAGLYQAATTIDPSTPLGVDGDGATAVAAWLALTDSLLGELHELYRSREPSGTTLWPEHFDLACELGDASAGTRANYGASPGDGAIAQPYLYVGPWDTSRRTGPLGAYPWGAGFTYDALLDSGDPKGTGLDFYLEGAALLLGQP